MVGSGRCRLNAESDGRCRDAPAKRMELTEQSQTESRKSSSYRRGHFVGSESSQDGASQSQRTLSVAVYLADQNPHRDRSLGITSMTQSVMQQFASREDLKVRQIISRSSHRQSEPQFVTDRIPLRTDTTLGRLTVDRLHRWWCRPQVDLWYYPKGYLSAWGGGGVPNVGTMHDTIVQHYADHYPESRSRRAFQFWINQTKRSLASLDCVLTVSQNASEQLYRFAERYRIKMPPVRVTYEGSHWENCLNHWFDKQDYVVHMASRAPHKKTTSLLRCWQQIQSTGRDLPTLRLVGHLDEEAQALMAKLHAVELSGPMPIGQLQMTVGRARALLLSSEIEGFGLPALESYYAGTPVCFSRGTATEEVLAGDPARGGFELEHPDSLEQSLHWAFGLSEDDVRVSAQQMYQRFNCAKIADGIVDAFEQTVRGDLR